MAKRIPRVPRGGGYVVRIIDPNTGREMKQSYGSYREAVRARDRKNPSRRLTKAQKKVNASKRAKQKRVAVALKKFLHAQNPAVKYDGAAIVKLKGGAVKITPIKANAGGKKTVLIGEYKLSDGWHPAGRVFDTAKEAAAWRKRVSGGEHARRTRRVSTSSGAYEAALGGGNW